MVCSFSTICSALLEIIVSLPRPPDIAIAIVVKMCVNGQAKAIFKNVLE